MAALGVVPLRGRSRPGQAWLGDAARPALRGVYAEHAPDPLPETEAQR
ncbi:hypothetical protein NE857_04160 [Nocardiopsis exhalans]|uniref:Uncharacterized protein n=1 Tax=Nocardiopsis exhalans TaxID=163604 RepID=A0ABY5DCU0_9ACTN|nr:hypothetical protein [Nocardiopsis exhalans]USY20855.1 hypothetical protein NE857_04160 [Nocardiopsis exhalans]